MGASSDPTSDGSFVEHQMANHAQALAVVVVVRAAFHLFGEYRPIGLDHGSAGWTDISGETVVSRG